LITSIHFSPKSRQDLLEIGDHIANDSPANARHFVAQLIAQCEKIARTPLGYQAREDLAPGLRMAALGRYVIFFRTTDGAIRIERILHGARHIPQFFPGSSIPEKSP